VSGYLKRYHDELNDVSISPIVIYVCSVVASLWYAMRKSIDGSNT
jgi:hypothetical protein